MPSIKISWEYSCPPLIEPSKLSALVPGETRKNESLNLALPIVQKDGPTLILLLIDVTPNLSRPRLEQRRFVTHCDAIRDLADFECAFSVSVCATCLWS